VGRTCTVYGRTGSADKIRKLFTAAYPVSGVCPEDRAQVRVRGRLILHVVRPITSWKVVDVRIHAVGEERFVFAWVLN
jgi:hypothetical protein